MVRGFANYALDRQGTVTATTNQSGGLVNTYRYDPWGSSVGTTGTQYNEYRYAGTYREPDLGMYQMGARFYMPTTGRFTQQDPLPSSVMSANRYQYAYNSPANYTDPTGLCPICIVVAPIALPTATEIAVAAGAALLTAGAVILAAKWIETWDGKTIKARPLTDREVRDGNLHREKEAQGYGPTDTIWVDTETGETYIGRPDGSGNYEPFP